METVSLLILFVLLLKTAVQLLLNAANVRQIQRHSQAVPPAWQGLLSAETYQKSVQYSLAKGRFATFDILYDAVIWAAVVFSGAVPLAYQHFAARLGQGLWAQGLFIFGAMLVLTLPELPLDYWVQFRLEQRFGFNRSTPWRWVTDKLKGVALSALIGYPFLCFLLWLVGSLGAYWWVVGFASVMAFELILLLVYPRLILPLFNRLTPLDPGSLRDRLFSLAKRTDFQVSNIQVIDGSKRSTHSNAFFTGFGRFRRIVLFDTLLSHLEEPEIEAVLAHEIGHSKKGHVLKGMALSGLLSFGGFALVAALLKSPGFHEALGIPFGPLGPALLLIGLLSSLASFWLTPLLNALSRRNEYEADSFARQTLGTGHPLIGALRKLTEHNLSNLTPHPWYSRFYYSHPTLDERETALRQA